MVGKGGKAMGRDRGWKVRGEDLLGSESERREGGRGEGEYEGWGGGRGEDGSEGESGRSH